MTNTDQKLLSWEELLTHFGEVRVIIKKPTRPEEWYKSGKFAGYKAGIWGGGGREYKHGFPQRFCSLDQHWIKKPKVLVAYDVYNFGGKQHSEWIDVDNCEFQIIKP